MHHSQMGGLFTIYIYIYINRIDIDGLTNIIWYMLTTHWNQHLFHSFEDFGCLSVMSYDALCVDTMTYFDGICSGFDYRILLPTRSFNSIIDGMCTALWPNVNFKLYMGYYNVFAPFCDTWNFRFCTLSDLAEICLFDDQYGRYVFGLFFLTR